MVYNSSQLVVDMAPHTTSDKIYLNTGMFGGYPAVNQFSRLLIKSNTQEMIKQKKPLVHGISFPTNDDLLKNVTGQLLVETSGARFFGGVAREGDIFQVAYGGNAGGFGDPIKRELPTIKKDLELGLLTPERCRSIYCVEAKYDDKTEEWVIDEIKTAELRERRKKERLAKGIPVNKWWQKRRQNIINGDMPQLLKKAYNGSLNNGKDWPVEFRTFWDLPADFTFNEED